MEKFINSHGINLIKDDKLIKIARDSIESFRKFFNNKMNNNDNKLEIAKYDSYFTDIQVDGEEIYLWEANLSSQNGSIRFEIYNEILEDEINKLAINVNWELEDEYEEEENKPNLEALVTIERLGDWHRGRWGWQIDNQYDISGFISYFKNYFFRSLNSDTYSAQTRLNEEFHRILESYKIDTDKKREIKQLIIRFCQKNKLKIVYFGDWDVDDPICSFGFRLHAKPEKVPIIYSDRMYKMAEDLENNLKTMFRVEQTLKDSDFDLDYTGFDEDYFTIYFYIDCK